MSYKNIIRNRNLVTVSDENIVSTKMFMNHFYFEVFNRGSELQKKKKQVICNVSLMR